MLEEEMGLALEGAGEESRPTPADPDTALDVAVRDDQVVGELAVPYCIVPC